MLQPEFRSWNDKVQQYLIHEHIPWCKPYGIYTDKFDEMLRQAQIGKVFGKVESSLFRTFALRCFALFALYNKSEKSESHLSLFLQEPLEYN